MTDNVVASAIAAARYAEAIAGRRHDAQLSYEDALTHIDAVLAEGEPSDGSHPGGEGWTCPHCGNTADSDGFFPSTPQGVEMEPTLDSDWAGHYVCGQCGDVRHQS